VINGEGIVYARCSSDTQREQSIEGQLRERKAYAEKHGITILTTLSDVQHFPP
jgi:DNA invertase Pin-like site-specific DNA recombinase